MAGKFSPLKDRMRTYEAVRGAVGSGWKGTQTELMAELSRAGFVLPSRQTISRWSQGLNSPFTNVLRADLRPSKHLSFYYGAWVGDGWGDTSDGGARMRLKVRSESFAEEFSDSANHILKRKRPCRVWRSNGRFGIWYNIKVTSIGLLEFVTKPFEEVLPTLRQYPEDFLRGFITAEGNPSVNISKREGPRLNVGLDVANSDFSLLSIVRTLLIELGYHPGTPRVVTKEGEGNGSITARRTCRVFSIGRRRDVERYALEIGFADEAKQKKLQDALSLISSLGHRNAATAWIDLYAKARGDWVSLSTVSASLL